MNTSGTDIVKPVDSLELSAYEPPELIIGIGNCGRADDGLGWSFLDNLRSIGFDGQIEYRYQLQIEDAELLSQFNSVLFVDASVETANSNYKLTLIEPEATESFSTHSLDPGTITYITNNLYNHSPTAHLLAIRGYEWGLREGLSDSARNNLKETLKSVHWINN